ncbi:MAG TPA: acyltransferase [Allosphingosinicella sp.]|nr:acyltransferase [Allosphingosinicella sp.]
MGKSGEAPGEGGRTAPAPRVHRMDWIDYGRLVCAFWVMLDHYCFIGLDPRINPAIHGYGALTAVTGYGITGLYFFFMTSGLVITLTAPRHGAADFATRRVVRIVPTFLICMTATFFLTRNRPVHPLQGLGQYLANLTFYPQAFGYRFVDAVYWTLAVEIVFYLFILLILMTGQMKRLPWILAAWIAAQIVCLPLGGQWLMVSPSYHFIAAGAVMALVYRREDPRLTLPLLAGSLLLCLHTGYRYTREVHTHAPVQMALVLLLFVLFPLMRGRNVGLPFAGRLGSATYPMYLLHFQIGIAVIRLVGTEANRWWLVAALSAFFLVLSLLLDDLIEFRLRRFWNRLFGGAIRGIAGWFPKRDPGRPSPGGGAA